ncbi:MAG: single-stranded DNA-binding protein [Actinomycetota bacterium]|nr:single-stranded DNA-binding protein [Actinomycetota bacterium]
MNVVVLRGRLSRAAEERVLRSGTRLVSLEVTVRRAGEKAESVPVSWFDPPPAIALLEEGDEVVVVGRVRRRFFRGNNGTNSRTEVAADEVVPARQKKKAAQAKDKALALLEEW